MKQYFTEDHQNAINQYVKSEKKEEKEKLYREFIGPAFEEMVKRIIFTYKFNVIPNVDDVKDECKIYLITILNKFDPERGTKAFSYFSVCTKNWLNAERKKFLKKRRMEKEYTSQMSLEDEAGSEPNAQEKKEFNEFFKNLAEEMKKWQMIPNMSKQEKRVLAAIEYLFDNINSIEIYNKKAIYLYLREITGMNTKQIVNNLNKLKVRYFKFKNKWVEGEI